DDGAGEDARERILAEPTRRAGDGDRAAVERRVQRERRDADEVVAEQRDPPRERVPPRLLDLGLVEAQRRLGIGERADVGVGLRRRLRREATRVGAEPPPRRPALRRQLRAVEEDQRRPLAHDSSQSGRIARVMSRMSRRSSSLVARPQYQYPLYAAWIRRSGKSVNAAGR